MFFSTAFVCCKSAVKYWSSTEFSSSFLQIKWSSGFEWNLLTLCTVFIKIFRDKTTKNKNKHWIVQYCFRMVEIWTTLRTCCFLRFFKISLRFYFSYRKKKYTQFQKTLGCKQWLEAFRICCSPLYLSRIKNIPQWTNNKLEITFLKIYYILTSKHFWHFKIYSVLAHFD